MRPLWVDKLHLGTLSLYDHKPEAFASRHVELTGLYATHAALALADAQRTAQLQAALLRRDIIGQAKGILIERDKITSDAAFEYLSRIAALQHQIDRGRSTSGRDGRVAGLTGQPVAMR